jgi:arginyl-tRNA synthetase
MVKSEIEGQRMLTYKGRPLIRKGPTIYYGSMSDKFIIQCQILETKKVKELDVATKVLVTLQNTDESIKAKDRVVKKSEKEGLYSAMDLAAVWLERALAAK